MIDRKTYWCYVVTYFTVIFCLGFLAGMADPGGTHESLYALINAGSLIWWVIGYWRCKDAGVHGGWAFFTPSLIGMIWIGCLRSKKELELL